MDIAGTAVLPGAAVEGIESQLDARADSKLLEDAKQVILDGVFAEPEAIGDLTVAQAFGDQTRDFFLALTERASVSSIRLVHQSGLY